MMNKLNHLALVACVSLKYTEPTEAKQFYRSPWFIKARSYVEQQGWDWYILSAHYGLLHPEQIIAPYDSTLNTMRIQQRKQWANHIFEQIQTIITPGCEIHFFAGERYRAQLALMLQQAGYRVEVPLIGLGIGQQLAWFKAHSATSNYPSSHSSHKSR